jgi:SAM-dependent methyltransferase
MNINQSNQLQWQDTVCDWCGTSAGELVFEGPDWLEGLPGSFKMVKCKECGLFRQNPRLTWDSLSNYYPENYAAYHYTLETKKNTWRAKYENYGNFKRRRAIEQFQPSGRLLEVGCGTGAFLKELHLSGNWDVVGIEPNQSAALYAQKTLDVPIYHGRFEDADVEPGSFDAVVLWCVLEHLTEPIKDLHRAHSLLKEGGWLFFSMPNYESLDAKLFGKYWSGWDLPRHLYIFPYPVISDVLSKVGFDNLSAKCISTSYQALGHSLDFWSQDWNKKHAQKRRWMLKIYYSWIMRVALLFPLTVIDRLKLGSNITFFAQKSSSQK